ncbi:15-hydroxyprostaglandin dehydrogenase [NAD(+)]-like [Phymastichus coffea]|uniref:15-hydroxyprostaglandin dehydrogenase [NAD(+)]-like n=1 Tax=Phymastichus coffea TaxID=108790 RepID=UPI00273CC8A9|nr:15-hydroxyprostaglandin dehydrogenase [NAD(+)]-like [Phymastichus coffea]
MYVHQKVAIVTGGIRGIGFVTVQHLLRKGAAFVFIQYVAIFDLHKFDSKVVIDGMTKLEQEFNSDKFGYYTCDVANIKEFISRYEEISKMKSYVDILINNAGICAEKKPEMMININFTAVVKCTMAAVDRMATHKGHKGGTVINVGSIYGLINIPLIPVYNATKHAVVSFVRSMKEHNKTIGMRIMCICPGLTHTDMTTTGDRDLLVYDFIPFEMVDNHVKQKLQDPSNVAAATIEILEKGNGGDVWMVKDDEPPFNVGEMTDIEKMRIPF